MIAAIVVLLLVATPTEASLIGRYDGSATELAAMLELRGDGSFRYGLSYGALDEVAEGRWRLAGDRVLIDQKPVVPPQIALVATTPATDATIRIALDVPRGMSRQYFDALIDDERHQLGEEGLELPVGRGDRPVQVRLALPILDVVSAPVDVAAGGAVVRFRFERNDAGTADLRASALTIEDGALVLMRHGRPIRFRRVP